LFGIGLFNVMFDFAADMPVKPVSARNHIEASPTTATLDELFRELELEFEIDERD